MRALRWTAAVMLLAAAPAAAQQAAQAGAQGGTSVSRYVTGWLGIGLGCECSIERVSRTGPEWRFRGGYPAINWLDNDGPAYRGGLRANDTLTRIDGIDLLTGDGGRALAAIRPEQRIELTYRREGRERRATIVVGMQRMTRSDSINLANRVRAESIQAASRAMNDSLREVSRRRTEDIRRAQQQMVEAQREMSRLQREMSWADANQLDSVRRSMERAETALREAQRRMGIVTPPTVMTVPSRIGKTLPSPNAPAVPARPAVPPTPMIAPTPRVATAPYAYSYSTRDATLNSETFGTFGRLRYSGRMGDAVVEARAPGAVNAVEEGDSVVVITAGDMSVRVSLRPRVARADTAAADSAAPAPAPRPARRPAPAPAPRRP